MACPYLCFTTNDIREVHRRYLLAEPANTGAALQPPLSLI